MDFTFDWLSGGNYHRIQDTDDYKFFLKNQSRLGNLFVIYKLNEYDEDFRVILGNILIKGLDNKDAIEHSLLAIKNQAENQNKINFEDFMEGEVRYLMEGRPMMKSDLNHIVIPFFSKALNYIYLNEPEKLLSYPYNRLAEQPSSSCYDFLDELGYMIYDSNFTSLIKIRGDKTSCAFYHPDFETIYIINDQGRLDFKITLFDKHIKHPDHHHILRRIEEVVDAFYSSSRNDFIDCLRKNNFISHRMHHALYRKLSLRMIKKTKIYRKGRERDEVL